MSLPLRLGQNSVFMSHFNWGLGQDRDEYSIDLEIDLGTPNVLYCLMDHLLLYIHKLCKCLRKFLKYFFSEVFSSVFYILNVLLFILSGYFIKFCQTELLVIIFLLVYNLLVEVGILTVICHIIGINHITSHKNNAPCERIRTNIPLRQIIFFFFELLSVSTLPTYSLVSNFDSSILITDFDTSH